MSLKPVLNIQYLNLLQVFSCNRACQNCSSHLAVGRQNCEVKKENGNHHGIPYVVKKNGHFSALKINCYILQIDSNLYQDMCM